MRVLFFIFFALLILFSCSERNNCLKSPGNTTKEEAILSSFDKVLIKSIFDVEITNATRSSISISTRENIMPFIKYEVINGELVIENTYECDWLKNVELPTIIISSPTLERIEILEACNLKSIGELNYNFLDIDCKSKIIKTDIHINCDTLIFSTNTTTGDYLFKGNCSYARFSNKGSGYLLVDNFVCERMDIIHESLGRSIINVTDSLYVESIKHGVVHLQSEICPKIVLKNNSFKKSFFSELCL